MNLFTHLSIRNRHPGPARDCAQILSLTAFAVGPGSMPCRRHCLWIAGEARNDSYGECLSQEGAAS